MPAQTLKVADRPVPAGVVILAQTPQEVDRQSEAALQMLTQHGLQGQAKLRRQRTAQGMQLRICLRQRVFERWCPHFDTLALHQRARTLQQAAEPVLEMETLLTMLAAPEAMVFSCVGQWQSHVRVRLNIARAAARTALAFNTEAAERPLDFWAEHPEHGFVLKPGVSLVDAIEAATQPEKTGRMYEFSCYRASEYLVLLGLAQEAQRVNPDYLAALEAQCRQKVLRADPFHTTYVLEYGSPDKPLPMRYYVPGDRVWFKNPDDLSSDVKGFEGSWVFYLGAGLFSNFWKREQPFDLDTKCLEIYHWRDGACPGADGALQMDEDVVAQAVARTRQDPAKQAQVLSRMMAYRDPAGVYQDGGCIDSTREIPRPLFA